jgi:hypothetical protein
MGTPRMDKVGNIDDEIDRLGLVSAGKLSCEGAMLPPQRR